MDLPAAALALHWLDTDDAPAGLRAAPADERSDDEAYADLEERVNAARAIL